MINTLNTIFKNSLIYPYCSATAYYIFNDISVSDKFGADCYIQTIRLKKQLLSQGIDADYIDDTLIGRHRALIFNYQNELYFMSPYLLHPKPVLLNSKHQSLKTYPFTCNSISILNISKENNIFKIAKYGALLNRKDSFIFNLHQVTKTEISDTEYVARILHPEQTTLSIRVVDFENGNDVLHYIFDFTKKRILTISEGRVFHQNSIKFNKILKRIAQIIDSSPEEIIDYISGAYKIREGLLKNV